MLLVLDSNIYIFSFGPVRESSCEQLLDKLLETGSKHTLRLPRIITEEVRRNVSPLAFKEFLGFINNFTEVDGDSSVPFELGAKYEARGLKPADAFISAFADWVGAAALVSLNRHFLSREKELPFKILTAEACLKLL